MQELISRLINKIAFFSPGGGSLRVRLQRMRGVKLGRGVFIGQYVYIDELHPEGIYIGDNCTIGLRTTIFSHFYWGPRRKGQYARVVLEKNVYVGPHCLILPGVTIGEGSVIKGETVISHNVPPHVFYGLPNPQILGKVTTPLTPESNYEEFVRGLKPLRQKKAPVNRPETAPSWRSPRG